MTDLRAFRQRFTEGLLHVAAENRGVSSIEAYRIYQTNAEYHAQVETIVFSAVQVIRGLELAPDDHLSEVFSKEAGTLLGWDNELGKWES